MDIIRRVLVFCAACSALTFAGCSLHYVNGDLNYLARNAPQSRAAAEEKPADVAHRVHVMGYDCNFSANHYKNHATLFMVGETETIGGNDVITYKRTKGVVLKELESFLSSEKPRLDNAFGGDPSRYFLNVSLVYQQDEPLGTAMLGSYLTGATFGLYPLVFGHFSIYYAIDVYDKRDIDAMLNSLNSRHANSSYDASGNLTGKKFTYDDLNLNGLKPLGRYEYRRGVTNRWFTILLWPIGLVGEAVFTEERALSRVFADMNSEFAADLQSGYTSAIRHNLRRDGYGIMLTEEQARTSAYGTDAASQIASASADIPVLFDNDEEVHHDYISSVARADRSGRNYSRGNPDSGMCIVLNRAPGVNNEPGEIEFGGAAASLGKINFEDFRGQDIKVVTRRFSGETAFKKWVKDGSFDGEPAAETPPASPARLSPKSEEGELVGTVLRIDAAKNEITVKTDVKKPRLMGEKMYLRIDGKAMVMEAVFPSMTFCRCRVVSAQGIALTSVKNGTEVHAWKKGI